MTDDATLVLRFAGPVQTWAGYRLIANKNPVPTSPIPRRSAVTGLLGAALGSRDLDKINADLHRMLIRVDQANSPGTDIQTLNPIPDMARADVDRKERVRTLGKGPQLSEKRGGGNFPTVLINRQFLPYHEFIVTLTAANAVITSWLHALQEPVFMPYLGRKANAPTFPFLLGTTTAADTVVLTALPKVLRHDEAAAVASPTRVYEVTGGYTNHHQTHLTLPQPPLVAAREEQLSWATSHLTR